MHPKLTLMTVGIADVARTEAFDGGPGWQKPSQSMADLILHQLGGIRFSLDSRAALADGGL